MRKYNKWIQQSGAGSNLEKERSELRDAISKKDNSLAINTKKKKNTKIQVNDYDYKMIQKYGYYLT